jgi:hypothetical protein
MKKKRCIGNDIKSKVEEKEVLSLLFFRVNEYQ